MQFGMVSWVGSSLHNIMVQFTLLNEVQSHKRHFFSPNCSNYVHSSADAPPHRTIRTELCTAYVIILHVPLLSQNYIYPIFLNLLKMYMAVRHLQFLVSNGKTTTASVHMILHLRFLSRLISGWYYKWCWISCSKIQSPILYSTKTVQTCQCIIGIHQNKQIWMRWKTTF